MHADRSGDSLERKRSNAVNRSDLDIPMSMLRAEEYFAPLRSRHISLQQWERGQLFDTLGRQGYAGGRLCRRQKSEGNIDQYIDGSPSPSPPHAHAELDDLTHHPQQVRPVKKVIARSLSLSAATGTGRNHNNVGGSEMLDIKPFQANNSGGFRRNLSFSRSLTSSGEITLVQELEDLEEEPDHRRGVESFECSVPGSSLGIELSTINNCESQKTPVARLLVSRSLNSSVECFGSELLEVDGSSSLRSVNWSSKGHHPASRSWPRKFLSGGLLSCKEKRSFSGVLHFAKSFGWNSHGWVSAKSLSSSPFNSKGSLSCSIQDGRLGRSNFFTRMLSFSRSLDSHRRFGGKSSNGYDESLAKDDGLNCRSYERRLSFSRSLDPSGELSSEAYDAGRGTADPFQSPDFDERTEFLGRRRGVGLSFSRSLDPGGEIVSDDEQRFKTHDIRTTRNQAEGRDGLESSGNSSARSDPNVSSERTSITSSSDATTNSGDSTEGASRAAAYKAPRESSWSKKLKVMTSRSGFFSKSLDSRKFRDTPHHRHHASMSLLEKDPTEPRPSKSKIFGRGFSLSFSRFLDPSADSTPENMTVTGHFQKDKKESRFKNFFTKGLFAFTSSKASEGKHNSPSAPGPERPSSANSSSSFSTDFKPAGAAASRKVFFRDWSTTWSKGRNTSSSSQSAQLLSSTVTSSAGSSSAAPQPPINQTHDLSSAPGAPKSSAGFTTSFPSLKNSRVLKYWWSKRGSSPRHSTASKSSDKQSRLVLLEKKPPTRQREEDNLTVYVGERGGSLTKYVLTKQILRHHLFQVLLKCSQDELGSDYDYKSGVPIICDPALFLQVARTVSGNLSGESEVCR